MRAAAAPEPGGASSTGEESQFPRNGLLAARIARRFAASPWLPDFVRSVYRANFERDLDISDPAAVMGCLAPSGDDPQAILREARLPQAKEQLRVQTEETSRLGIFGAPSFVVGHELFWGNDRLEDALSWAADHAP